MTHPAVIARAGSAEWGFLRPSGPAEERTKDWVFRHVAGLRRDVQYVRIPVTLSEAVSDHFVLFLHNPRTDVETRAIEAAVRERFPEAVVSSVVEFTPKHTSVRAPAPSETVAAAHAVAKYTGMLGDETMFTITIAGVMFQTSLTSNDEGFEVSVRAGST